VEEHDEPDRAAARLQALINVTFDGIVRRRYESASEREMHRCLDRLTRLSKVAAIKALAAAQEPRYINEISPEARLQYGGRFIEIRAPGTARRSASC